MKRKYLTGWKETRCEILKKRSKLNETKELRNVEILKLVVAFLILTLWELFWHKFFSPTNRHYLGIWQRKYLNLNAELQTIKLADEQYRHVQTSKCFQVWYFKFKAQVEEKRNVRLADQHFTSGLVKKCWHSIRIYRLYRRKKAIQKLKLKEYYESQLVFRIYQTWLARYEARKRLYQLEDMVESFRQKHMQARVFEYWKTGSF